MEANEIAILKATKKVHLTSKKAKLILKNYDTVKNEIQYISSYFQINEIQSVLLANFISLSSFDVIELKELIDYLVIKKIELLPYLNDIQYLIDKNILDKVTNKNLLREDYCVKKSCF